MSIEIKVPVLAEMVAEGKNPDYLFWVGCAGSYDARAQKITKAFCQILEKAGVSYAILGDEEGCTGDPARRAGNEFVFQMLAHTNIETLNAYKVTKIVTACPHCFNTIKNEYPELGGHYEVIHHTELIRELLKAGKLKIDDKNSLTDKTITYHDSCYIGRINNEYDNPRAILKELGKKAIEMKDNKCSGLCCGAGGAQMFKEEEKGKSRVNEVRAKQALDTKADIIAVNCPFCTTMMEDGVKAYEKQDDVEVYDLAELILKATHNDEQTSE
jgi:Fe-S oxidoreductase